MATDLDTLKRIAPTMDSLSDIELGEWLLLAKSQVSPDCASATKYQLIVAYLAAHMYTIANELDEGQASPLIGKKSGKESVSYSTTVGQTDLDMTKYGQEYKRLIKTLACTKPLTSSRLFLRC